MGSGVREGKGMWYREEEFQNGRRRKDVVMINPQGHCTPSQHIFRNLEEKEAAGDTAAGDILVRPILLPIKSELTIPCVDAGQVVYLESKL